MGDVMKTISIVTPCYNEEDNIKECYQDVKAVFDAFLPEYKREHIFCDNASDDSTLDILREIAKLDPAVRIIVNSRNFGPMRSNFNGVLAASGDAVLLFMPADLQDPPELLPKFVALWEQGYETVYGIRATREEGVVMRTVRSVYYRIVTTFSGLSVPPKVGDFQLADRKVVEAMRQIKDNYPFMRMMTFECGFRSIGISYHWRGRRRGFSKNRMCNLLDQGMNGLVTFNKFPLRIALYGGFMLSALSISMAIFNVLVEIISYQKPAAPGIMTIIIGMFFFSGVQLFFLGFMSEYVMQIYDQVRNTPRVVERERINFPKQVDMKNGCENME